MSDPMVRHLARELAAMRARIRAMEVASQAAFRSIEGGSIDVYDDETDELLGVIGQQRDGSFGFNVKSGKKPEAPTEPDVQPIPGGAIVAWDGRFEDRQSALVIDRIAVHMDETPGFVPDRDTEVAAVRSTGAGGTAVIPLDDGVETYVKLVAVSKGGVWSDPSVEVVVAAVDSEIGFYQDDYTVTAAGPQTFKLTYSPDAFSEHLYWNGRYQHEDVAWTREGTTITTIGGGPQPGDVITVEYAYLPQDVTRTVYIQMESNSHSDNLSLTFILPDGSRYAVPGVNTPGAGPAVEFGSFVLEDMQVEFKNNALGKTWTYPDAAHIRRVQISGVDGTLGVYTGYRYSFEDSDTANGGDGDFNDIVMTVKAYDRT